jgi:acetolactate synthase regulatory subunit
VHHHLELTLVPTDPMALERVLVLCRARRCPIVALRFDADDEGGRVLLTVDGEPGRLALLTHRIDALIGVRTTAPVGSAAPAAPTR